MLVATLRMLRRRLLGVLAAAALWGGIVPASGATEIAWVWHDSDAPSQGFTEAAVLVETLVLRDSGVERMPRTRPLVLPGGMTVTPVIHVEARTGARVALAPAQKRAVLEALERHAAAATAGRLQLDFEAPARLRAAYVDLVREARERLPARLRLSVTALAAWCTQGDWLDALAADEIVPMLYRMGPASAAWRARWTAADARLHARCRAGAAGYSVQDPPDAPLLAGVARRYWFNERNWPRVMAAYR